MLPSISIILYADFNNKINGKQIYMGQTVSFYKAPGDSKKRSKVEDNI